MKIPNSCFRVSYYVVTKPEVSNENAAKFPSDHINVKYVDPLHHKYNIFENMILW